MQAQPPPPPPSGPPPQWQPLPPPYAYAPPAYGYAPQPYVQLPYAGFWIRLAAYLLDGVVLFGLRVLIGIVLSLFAALLNPTAVNDLQSSSVTVMSNVVGLLLTFAYFAGLWTLNGQTYGQKWLGLRVLDAATLQPPRPGQAAIRWIGLEISLLVLCIGVVWVAFDPRKQGWMDKMAGTIVVRA